MPGVPLQLEEHDGPLLMYEYHVRLRVDTAWRVPVLYGKLPMKPDDQSTREEKGSYALFIMLLFRPWRGVDRNDFVRSALLHCASENATAGVWENLYAEYERWRRVEVDAVGAPFLSRLGNTSLAEPEFNSAEWWACMLSLKLRNVDLVLSRHKHTAYERPVDLTCFPPEQTPVAAGDNGGEDDNYDDRADDEDPNGRLPSEAGFDVDDAHVDAGDTGTEVGKVSARGKFPVVAAHRCGSLPTTSSLSDYLSFLKQERAHSAEARYSNDYVDTFARIFAVDNEVDPMLAEVANSSFLYESGRGGGGRKGTGIIFQERRCV